jgi:hypothetical protein
VLLGDALELEGSFLGSSDARTPQGVVGEVKSWSARFSMENTAVRGPFVD